VALSAATVMLAVSAGAVEVPVQTPPPHASPTVHALPSEHAVPLDCPTHVFETQAFGTLILVIAMSSR
jgi:hypothetical protein